MLRIEWLELTRTGHLSPQSRHAEVKEVVDSKIISFPNAVLGSEEILKAELSEFGSCLCKNVLSENACDDLKMKAENLLLRTDWKEDRACRSLSKGVIHFGHLASTDQGSEFVFDIFNYFRKSKAIGILEAMFGRSIAFPLRLCTVRIHQSSAGEGSFNQSQLPLHQDNFPRDLRIMMVNTWLTLDDCGEQSPGLELFRTPLTEYFFGEGLTKNDMHNSNIPKHEVGYQAMIRRFGESCVARPVFQAGDAAMFNRFTLHRTNVTPGMIKSRISVELRGCSGKNLINNYNFLSDCQENIVISKTKRGTVMQRNSVLAYDKTQATEERGTIKIG